MATGQLALIGGAALSLVLPAWRAGEDARRIAVTGLLLMMPWVLLTLMPGYGPPFAATLAMNHVRYVILFVSTIFLGAGFLVLKDPLSDRGERVAAPLGQAAGLIGALIQLVWAAILIGWTMSEVRRPKVYIPLDRTPLADASDVLLFFAGLLTYAATALYALSFRRVGWLGKTKAMTITVICIIAMVGLVARGLEYPDLSKSWYLVPGMIVGIPAIPWIMPYLLGVCTLMHATDDPYASSEGSDFRFPDRPGKPVRLQQGLQDREG